MTTINLLDLHAADRVKVPEWAVYRYEAIDGCFVLTGAVAPLLKSGKNKGQRNWRKLDSATERKIIVTRAEHDAWCEAWSVRTGNCIRCTGDGKILQRWSAVDGSTYRECPDCGGTGKRAGTEAVHA